MGGLRERLGLPDQPTPVVEQAPVAQGPAPIVQEQRGGLRQRLGLERSAPQVYFRGQPMPQFGPEQVSLHGGANTARGAWRNEQAFKNEIGAQQDLINRFAEHPDKWINDRETQRALATNIVQVFDAVENEDLDISDEDREQYRQQALAIMQQYPDAMKDALSAEFGLDDTWWNEHYEEAPEPGFMDYAPGLVGQALQGLTIPGQWLVGTLGTLGRGDLEGAAQVQGHTLSQILGPDRAADQFAALPFIDEEDVGDLRDLGGWMYERTTEPLLERYDQNDNLYLEGREMFGYGGGPGFNVPDSTPLIGGSRIDIGGFADLAVDLVLDPLNLVTFGAGSGARAGLAAIRSGGRDIAEAVTARAARAGLDDVAAASLGAKYEQMASILIDDLTKGRKTLSMLGDEERLLVETLIMRSVHTASQSGGVRRGALSRTLYRVDPKKAGKLRERVQDNLNKLLENAPELSDETAEWTQHYLQSIDRNARGGIGFMGRSARGTGRPRRWRDRGVHQEVREEVVDEAALRSVREGAPRLVREAIDAYFRTGDPRHLEGASQLLNEGIEASRRPADRVVREVPEGFDTDPRQWIPDIDDYYDPDTQDVIGLYHVTTAVDDVIAQGLRPTSQLQNPRGLGGVDSKAGGRTSLTTSYEYAQGIAETLSAAAKLARGAATLENGHTVVDNAESLLRYVEEVVAGGRQAFTEEENVTAFYEWLVREGLVNKIPAMHNPRQSMSVDRLWDALSKQLGGPEGDKFFEVLRRMDEQAETIFGEGYFGVGLARDKNVYAGLLDEQIEVLPVAVRKNGDLFMHGDPLEVKVDTSDVIVLHERGAPTYKRGDENVLRTVKDAIQSHLDSISEVPEEMAEEAVQAGGRRLPSWTPGSLGGRKLAGMPIRTVEGGWEDVTTTARRAERAVVEEGGEVRPGARLLNKVLEDKGTRLEGRTIPTPTSSKIRGTEEGISPAIPPALRATEEPLDIIRMAENFPTPEEIRYMKEMVPEAADALEDMRAVMDDIELLLVAPKKLDDIDIGAVRRILTEAPVISGAYKAWRGFMEIITPRYNLMKRKPGAVRHHMPGIEEAVDARIVRALGHSTASVRDLHRFASDKAQRKLIRRALKWSRENGGWLTDEEDWHRVVNRVLSTSGATRKAALDQLDPGSKQFIEALLNARDATTALNLKIGMHLAGLDLTAFDRFAGSSLPEQRRFIEDLIKKYKSDPVIQASENYELGLRYLEDSLEGVTETYIPRQINQQAMERLRNVIRDLPESERKRLSPRDLGEETYRTLMGERSDAGGVGFRSQLKQGNAQMQREFKPYVQDLFELNEEFRNALAKVGITAEQWEYIGDVYSTNAAAAIALRSTKAAESYAMFDTLKALETLPGKGNRGQIAYGFQWKENVNIDGAIEMPVAVQRKIIAQGGDPGDYVWWEMPGGVVGGFVDKDVVDHLKDTTRFFANFTAERGKIASNWDAWNRAWAGSATGSLLGLTGFHARNAFGNLFNNYLVGVRNPRVYARAAKIQDMHREINRLQQTGIDWDRAAARYFGVEEKMDEILANSTVTVPEAARMAIDPVMTDDYRALLAARQHNVLSSSRSQDILEGGSEGVIDRNQGLTRVAKAIDPTNPQLTAGNSGLGRGLNRIWDTTYGGVNRKGMELGTAIENNARLANFIDGIEKGMHPDLAARRTRQALFDYNDLTNFESEKIRMVSRFYTFMRKNLSLQAYILLHHPGALAQATKLERHFEDALFGEPEAVPAELREQFWRQGYMYYPEVGGFIGLESPFQAALETTRTLYTIPSVLPGIDNPEWINAGRGAKDNVGEFLGLFAGPLTGIVTSAFEARTGMDMFTLRPISEEDSRRSFLEWMENLYPGAGKVGRWMEMRQHGSYQEMMARLAGLYYSNVDDPIQFDDEDEPRSRRQRAVDSDIYEFMQIVRSGELNDLYRDSGLEAPTWTETREMYGTALNDALLTLLYTDPEDLTFEQMNEYLPKEFLQNMMNLAPPYDEEEEWDPDQAVREAQTMYYGLTGKELSVDEAANLILTMGFFTTEQAEAMGLEPVRYTNVFVEDPEEVEIPQQVHVNRLHQLEQLFGMVPGSTLQARPLQTNMDRLLNQAIAAGKTPDDVWEYLWNEELNMEEKVNLGFSIREYGSSLETEEERQSAARKAWEMAAEIRWVSEYLGRGQLSFEQINEWVARNTLTVEDQELAFGERIGMSVPRYENIATDEEKAMNALLNRRAIETGTRGEFGPIAPDFGPPPDEVFEPGPFDQL